MSENQHDAPAHSPSEQELKDKYLRALADLENTRKRADREIEEAVRLGREEVIKHLVPVFDDLERAMTHAPPGPLRTGLRLVESDFLARLDKYGVTRFSAESEAFNPERHQAVAQRLSRELPPGTVVEQLASGYLHRGRLLRPALVVVAAAPIESAPVDPEPEAA